jgi:hypothetical protein
MFKMETHINMKAACRMWADYMRENLLHMCRDMIYHHLMKNSIQFEKNKKVFEPPIEVADAFSEYWEIFVKDALDSALCLGFVVVNILEDDTKRKYPSVVRPDLYELHYRIVDNKYEYWLSSSYINVDNTFVYTHFGEHALPNGELTSAVSRVMNKCIFLKELRFTTLIMEKNKSNPDYFSEVVETSNKERHEGVDYDFFADTTEDDPESDMKFERSKANVEILMKQQELYHQYMGRGSKQVKNLRNITQLPNGQHVVPTAQNTGRQDITQIHKILQEEICSGMGVPRSLMIGDSLFKSDTEGVTDTFKHTILFWKKTLSYMCTDLYQKLYVDFKKLKVYKNVYTSKMKHQILVVFPVHPYISFEELDYLYKNGVIGWDVYSKHCLQNTSIPYHLREKKAPSREYLEKIDVTNTVSRDTKRKRTTE